MLASTTLTAMLARRGQLEVVVMPPAAWSAREIEQALATLAALAQISRPSAAHFLKSAMARDGGLVHVGGVSTLPCTVDRHTAHTLQRRSWFQRASLPAVANAVHQVGSMPERCS